MVPGTLAVSTRSWLPRTLVFPHRGITNLDTDPRLGTHLGAGSRIKIPHIEASQ